MPRGRGWTNRAVIAAAVAVATLSSALGAAGGSQAAAATSTSSAVSGARPVNFACTYDLVNQAFTGAFATASAIGWEGNGAGVVTCLGGSFYVYGPYNRSFGFGIYDGSPTTWVNADGYLPAQITSFHRGGASVAITEFGDELSLRGHRYVAVYARVAITNPTASVIVADPKPSAGLISLNRAGIDVPAHSEVVHDYAIVSDNFNTNAPWPSGPALAAAGGFDQHYRHMRSFWNGQLSQIAAVNVPDRQLVDAYRSGFIYTQIARSGNHLDTGVNNYFSEFSHDVIGILTNLFTQGYDTDAHALLLDARSVVGQQGQYLDGVWTLAWPWAVYLMKTGDTGFVKANFAGPSSRASGPTLEAAAHRIASERTGPGGIMLRTNDIDTNGYWTVDNFEALTGLAAYAYVARTIGSLTEAHWAEGEYASLLAAVNRTLVTTMHRFNLGYLPCSMLQPNSANRCHNPEDANWAAPFLFGRWAWDAALLGAPVSGPGVDLIDATYRYGFARLKGLLPPDTFGGYPNDFYSTGYNAGYGSWGLASVDYRSQGILSYQFMIQNDQSGPYSWWESSTAPGNSPWVGRHPAGGGGSSPHAWGMANANKVLLDSLAAQTADGTLLVGRGVPNEWVTPGQTITVTNFPTRNGGRVNLRITGGNQEVTLVLSGEGAGTESVDFELPVFVDNIAGASAGTVNEHEGLVHLAAGPTSVTVRLSH